ncbi:Eac protein [Serratia proteamaculans]|uniref:Eac protein n=1 Tax=Serratia proteamaculans TaxID=28151 RepID=UPI0010203D1D|nr:Eac protein [Serratia proteamaculans]RYM48032.1 Eac protein [Serratia proteamaculans]
MTDNAKHFDHFKVEGPAIKALIESFDAIGAKRIAITNALQDEFGAIAHTTSSGFGDKGSRVVNLVWDAEYTFPCETTIRRRDYFNGAPVVFARGKGNTKEGRAFNKKLDAGIAKANRALADLPPWQAFIIDHYGIMRTGFGTGTAKGIPMLSTYGGRCPGRDDCLLFAIPNTKSRDGEVGHGDVIIPAEFQKLTYGQFYDLTHTADAEDDDEAPHG